MVELSEEQKEAIKTATRSRGQYERWLNTSAKECSDMSSKDLNTVSLPAYNQVLKDFEQRLLKYDTAQSKLEDLVEESALDDLVKNFNQTRSLAVTCRVELETKWLEAHPSNPSPSVAPASRSNDSNFASSKDEVKLPKIQLPTFNGEVLKWTTFWQQFESCVDSKSDLASVVKFSYLVGQLKGDAKTVLDGLPVTNENYEAAKKIVKNRYGRRELLIFTHVQALLSLTTTNDTSKLIVFHDKLLANVRALDSLGIKAEHFGVILTPIIISRVPQCIRDEWSKESEGKEGDLTFLLDFLEKEVRRRDRARSLTTEEKPSSQSANGGHNKHKNLQGRQTAAFFSNRANQHGGNKREKFCDFCLTNYHNTCDCKDYLNLDRMKRRDFLRENFLCFKCMFRLSQKHKFEYCRGNCSNCHQPHHVSLCPTAVSRQLSGGRGRDQQHVRPQAAMPAVDGSPEVEQSAVDSLTATSIGDNVANASFLPTACVKVWGGSGVPVEATLMFDSGSDRSYVSESLVRSVKPKWVRNTEVSFSTFGGRRHGNKSKVFNVGLSGACQQDSQVSVELTEVPIICLPLSRPVLSSSVLSHFEHLDLAYDFANSQTLSIDVLIGQDLYWSLMCDNVFRDESCSAGIVAQESLFGWVLSGSSEGSGANSGVSMLNLCTVPDHVVKSFWDLESIGVKDDSVNPVFQKFCDEVEFNEESGRYSVGLTWKDDHPPLLDNRRIAWASVNRLEKRLEKDPVLKEGYERALDEMESLGFISEVKSQVSGSVSVESDSVDPVFYLPHHPVVKEGSTSTKIRPVFNASCRGVNGVSLNDCLDAGPNLNPLIVDVLARFRRWPYVVSADVKKAFLQIEIQEKDQDVHRFLWKKDDVIRVMKFLRVTFGVKCSPFLLSGTVEYHLSRFPPSTVIKELHENLYVDDFLSGADSEAEVKCLFEQANEVMMKASLELAKWKSNESSVLGPGFDSNEQSVKVLGVSWDPEKDVFTFLTADLPVPIRCTKRVVLSLVARVFDPLGFVLPYTMTARFLFQDVWRLGLEWDEELPDDLRTAFLKWLGDLKVLRGVTIPRQFLPISWTESLSSGSLELHAFGDASLKGYGACVYLACTNASGEVKSVLVRSCARVAPLERKTLPRLELLGCLVTAQLLQCVIRSLQLGDIKYTCWSDSMVALGWIKGSPSKWKPWVANRVSTIQSLTNPCAWRHVDGVENPADLVSRGVPAEKLLESKLWWQGPCISAELPEVPVVIPLENSADVQSEMRVGDVSVLFCADVPVEWMFRFERWSTLNKAYRVLAIVLKFISRTRKLCQSVEITAEDLSQAKKVFIKLIQVQEFGKEIQCLKSGKNVPSSSKLSKLSPFLDDEGIMRVSGRIQLSELAYESKHPIILPKCHGSMLLIRFVHCYQNHAGVDSMIAFVKKDFEIFGLRLMAKSTKRDCVYCQRVDARSCNELNAPLPKLRVSMAPVFTVTGIDHAGPVYCLDFPNTKFYIVLFVCGVVRAIHLELVESLSCEHFMLAFRKFCALKRAPSVIYTDNAKNFKGAERVLESYMGPLAPEWKFICPRSPWWGGWWEVLVRSVKFAIRKTLAKRFLLKTEFEACLAEVSNSVNSRPLTYVGADSESKTPLSPNHFLSGQGNQGLYSRIEEDPESVSVEGLSVRHQEFLERQDQFWKVWSADYLRNLPPAFQKFRKRGNLKVGSVVLVREDNQPRLKWSMGVVQKLFEGIDGVPRAAEIKTASGVYVRAIQRLHNLEINSGLFSDVDSSSAEAGAGVVEVADQPPVAQPMDLPIADVQKGMVDQVAGVEEVEAVVDEGVVGDAVDHSGFRTRSGRQSKISKKYDGFVLYK